MSSLSKSLRVALWSALAAALLHMSLSTAQAQTRLKFGHIVGTDHPIHIGAQAMSDHI